MRFVRTAAIALLALSTPVFLGTVGWGLILVQEHMPMWLWSLVMVLNFIAVLGVASLIDESRDRAGLPPL